MSNSELHQVFCRMGIPDPWVLIPESASEIRRAFAVFSQSAVSACRARRWSNSAVLATESVEALLGRDRDDHDAGVWPNVLAFDGDQHQMCTEAPHIGKALHSRTPINRV